MKKQTMTTAELKNKMMKDPEFRKEYEALEEEFALAGTLIRARAAAKMTQQEVAEKMGTDQAVVARLEGGKRPSLETLRRYAKAVGKTLRVPLV